MKRMNMVFIVLGIALATVFAGDMTIGVKGIVGADKSGNNGPLMGGGVDVLYHFNDHVGIKVEANACGANFTFDDGLKVQDNLYISVPVELWASYAVKNLDFGAGVGLATTFRDSSISVDLSASANATYWFNEFGLSFGCTGVVDCFPSLQSEGNGDGSKTYSFKKSEGKDSSFLASIGLSYRFGQNAN